MPRHRTIQSTAVLLAILLSAGLFGCDGDKPVSSVEGASDRPAAALPADVLLSDAPLDPTPVAQLKQSAGEGDPIVLRGVIGGRASPIVAGRAIMTIVEATMANQCQVAGDHCETPWDYCCASREELQQNIATIQVVDVDGNPLAADLAATPGLEPLAIVTIKGTVGPRPDRSALIVNATGIFIETSP